MKTVLLEIIAFNLESCSLIETAGAHRIELCDNPADGGTTPSAGFMEQARKITTLPIFPILRPRGGNFVYSGPEFQAMLTDIHYCRETGMDGIVTGILTRNGEVDIERNKKLIEAACELPCTFHRAFDRTVNIRDALEKIIDCGFKRVLTSGNYPTAEEGLENLKMLVEQAADRIIVMPGSGVRSSNIKKIVTHTGCREIHSSARTLHIIHDIYQPVTMRESTAEITTDTIEIEKMLHALSN
ncbi:MAG: copper homeostasis protein CutC [Ferruginibacter sp.]